MPDDHPTAAAPQPRAPLPPAPQPAGSRERPDPKSIDRKARLRMPSNLPAKQPPAERVHNWDEVYFLFDPEFAKAEATRCIQCPAAPCTKACPVHNDIPGAFWLLEQDDIAGAANVFRETSALPEMCGRLCPQERLCEGHCVVGKNAPPVAIGKLEVFVTEWQRAHAPPVVRCAEHSSGRSVAIVGSGPAGIGAAERLAGAGHRVVMYEAWPLPGGLLRYGIPDFKQNKPAVDRAFRDLAALGVEVRTNTRVGDIVALEQLASEYDAVFLAFGATEDSRLGIANEDAAGMYRATEFLVRGNLEPHELPEPMREPLPAFRSVVVVGGGDTSMDCVRTARRLGVPDVTLVYRRTNAEMQGRIEERRHAVEEGVRFEFLTAPVEVLVDDRGAVRALRCRRMRLGEPDESGRARPEVVPDSEFEIPADAVVTAIGYNVDPDWGTAAPAVARDRWGRVVVDPESMRTSVRGVFAGGDGVNGADLVVTALADGQKAAAAIDAFLSDGSW
ncbi:MAG: NAD(P)-dependent oxidoreductase [Dehalococcoidia bacterium]|nr:NAD(P)-dependent oxidoreductase [Dehalococcoidia bacterium]